MSDKKDKKKKGKSKWKDMLERIVGKREVKTNKKGTAGSYLTSKQTKKNRLDAAGNLKKIK